MTHPKLCRITSGDLQAIIEDVGFGKIAIDSGDSRGIVINGYLDLAGIAERINTLIEIRADSQHLIDNEQPR